MKTRSYSFIVAIALLLASFTGKTSVKAAAAPVCLTGSGTANPVLSVPLPALTAGDSVGVTSKSVNPSDTLSLVLFSPSYGPVFGPIGAGSVNATFTISDPASNWGMDLWDLSSGSVTYTISINGGCGAVAGRIVPIFTDGRLNNMDSGQNAAVYCNADGSVTVYSVYGNTGYLAFTATAKEINAVPKHPAKNTLIKQGKGARLYRLTDGQLQVNRAFGKNTADYVYIFEDCVPAQ
jgi:hypothetical protein